MVAMDSDGFGEREIVIDLESGMNATIGEDEGSSNDGSGIAHAKMLLDRVWSGFGGLDKNEKAVDSVNDFSNFVNGCLKNEDSSVGKRFAGEEKLSLSEKKVGTKRLTEKARRKPPKPPRPPNSPLLDAADRKLVREISELAILKRARIERIKALKNMRKTKAGSSNSNLCALLITILFCIIIIWQGVFSKNSSSVSIHGSPKSSVVYSGELIPDQFHWNLSSDPRHSRTEERVSGLNGHGEASKDAG